MASQASVRAEIAFTTNPLVRPGGGAWTAVESHTAGLRSFSSVRGVDLPTGNIEAGTASCVVDNAGGALDPENTASPWYPNVKFNRRIRFYVDPPGSAAEQLVFTGFIDHLPTRWETSDGWVELTAVDLFALLAGQVLPPSVLHVETENAAPVSYWPLSETIGTNAEDVVGFLDGTYAHDVSAGRVSDSLSPWAEGGQQWQTRSQQQPLSQQVTLSPWTPVDDWSIGFAFRAVKTFSSTAAGSLQDGNIWLVQSNSNANDFVLIQTRLTPAASFGKIFVFVSKGGNSRTWTIDGLICDGQPHYVVVTMDHSGGNGHVYVDGVDLTNLTSTIGTFPAAGDAATASIGLSVPDDPLFANATETAAWMVGHVAYWNRVLTPTEVVTLSGAMSNPWNGDTTGARAGRILDILGVDAGDRSIATGTAVCGPTFLKNENALSYLRKIAATEGGALFVNPDGKVTFRAAPANNPTVVAVISDSPAADAGSPYKSVHPDYSPNSIVNQAVVTREGGIQQTASNQTSIDAYGVRGPQSPLPTLLSTASATRSRAAQIVNRGKDPSTVIDQVEVFGELSNTSATLTLGTDLQDAIRLIARPTGGGSSFTQVSLIQRITHTVDPHNSWVVGFGLTRHVVLSAFAWDGASGTGWDEAVWP